MVAAIGVSIGVLEAFVLRIISELASSLSGAGAGAGDDVSVLGIGMSRLGLSLLGMAAVVVVIALRWAEARVATRLSLVPMERVRARLVDAWLQTDHVEQLRHRTGRVQELLTGHAPAVGGVVLGFAAGLSAALIVLVLAISAMVVEPASFLMLIVALAVLAILVTPLQRRIRRFAKRQGEEQLAYGTFVNETVSASEAIQLFATDRAVSVRHDDASRRAASAGLDIMALRRFASNLYRSLTLLLLLVGLGVLVSLTKPDLAAASTVVLLLIRGLLESQAVYVNSVLITERLPYLDELDHAIATFDESARATGVTPLAAVTSVELNKVTFGYDPDTPTARQLDLVIRAGDRIGLVGPSGTGKSTLLRLIYGLLTPDAGSITINGTPPSQLDPVTIAREIAVVPQHPLLLTASVIDNVQFDRPWVTRGDAERALADVGLLDEVTQWPEGVDTLVGHRGARALSGGQQQRVSLARALAGSPSLVLMDEPTSALDDAAEAHIVDALDALGPGCASVVVSHRESSLRGCTRIVELDDGKLREVVGS